MWLGLLQLGSPHWPRDPRHLGTSSAALPSPLHSIMTMPSQGHHVTPGSLSHVVLPLGSWQSFLVSQEGKLPQAGMAV